MRTKNTKKIIAWLLSATVAVQLLPTPVALPVTKTVSASTLGTESIETEAVLNLEKTGEATIGTQSSSGGLGSGIAYNPDNQKVYQINGKTGILSICPLEKDGSFGEAQQISLQTLVDDFTYGKATGIAIDTVNHYVAVTIEASDYRLNGQVLLLSYNGKLLQHFETGVQPAMVTFTKDGSKMLTANEGEARKGYSSSSAVDPDGSVTVVNLATEPATVQTIGFENFDSEILSEEFGILIKKYNNKIMTAQKDLEPESIAVNDEGTIAYVCLQEANAIATLDLTTNTFTDIQSLGFVDYMDAANAIDVINDGEYMPNTFENTYGVPMPHSISTYEVDGTTYIVTANEGSPQKYTSGSTTVFNSERIDSSPTITAMETLIDDDGNETAITAAKVHSLNPKYFAGLLEGVEEDGSDTPFYLFGTRSFSIYDAESMSLIYDSGCSIEEKLAEILPEHFNSSATSNKMEAAATARGAEPKDVTIGTINSKTYAFISFETNSGIMVFDISDPNSPEYVNYINSRDFSANIKGDVSPNGIAFINTNDTASELPMLLANYDISGTMAAYSITGEATQEVSILYTNDVRCNAEGYPYLAACREQSIKDGYRTILADAGDAVWGDVIGTASSGSAIVDLMNQTGYDLAVPGDHEFDYHMDTFLQLAQSKADYTYLSSNLINKKTGDKVLKDYEIKQFGEKKIAFVGITTPESYTKATSPNFEDDAGNVLYDFCEEDFYDVIQNSINSALSDGADYVIAIGHTGVDGITEGLSSVDIIENTTGINAYIDAHTMEIIDGDMYYNKDGDSVLLTSTGSEFTNFGKLNIDANGDITSELIETTSVEYESSAPVQSVFQKMQETIATYYQEVNEGLLKNVGTSQVNLVYEDKTSDTVLPRIQETNLGDFVADACRTIANADIALIDAGEIHAGIEKGTLCKKSFLNVHPSESNMCVVRATGQQIADALEFSAKDYPEESAGFLQVSGICYTLNQSAESPVKTDNAGNFVSVSADARRRIEKITVNGKDLVNTETYTIVSTTALLLDCRNGYTMFKDDDIVQNVLPKNSDMLLQYLTNTLDGIISSEQYGKENSDGRIFITEDQKEPEGTPGETPSTPGSGDNDSDNDSGNDSGNGSGGNSGNGSGGNSGNGSGGNSGNGSDNGSGNNTGNSSGNGSDNTDTNNRPSTGSNSLNNTPSSAKPNNSVASKKIVVKKATISSLKASKKKLKVTIKKLSGVKGYQIKYSTSRKFSKSKTKTITTKKRTVTLKKLKSGKKYYVKVRAYRYNTSKKKVYGKYSKVKVKKVK